MKKYFSLLLIMMLILTGCNTKNDDITNDQGSQNNDVTNNDNIPVQPSGIVCKRATTLHTELCKVDDSSENDSTTGGCNKAGYSNGDTITYGSLGTSGILTSGDAFDCDVDGNGKYDSKTERFYYVSDLYDTNSKTFNDDYAVLIYYDNVSRTAYDSSEKNYYGPRTAVKALPTTKEWKNVNLSSVHRAILSETDEATADDKTLPTAFSYEGYVARLITVQEINKACGITAKANTGELDRCNYLMENTEYSDALSSRVSGFWLETPDTNDGFNSDVLCVDSYGRYVWGVYSDIYNVYGVRPAIEVPKDRIEY